MGQAVRSLGLAGADETFLVHRLCGHAECSVF